jgi:hypothetical protein
MFGFLPACKFSQRAIVALDSKATAAAFINSSSSQESEELFVQGQGLPHTMSLGRHSTGTARRGVRRRGAARLDEGGTAILDCA